MRSPSSGDRVLSAEFDYIEVFNAVVVCVGVVFIAAFTHVYQPFIHPINVYHCGLVGLPVDFYIGSECGLHNGIAHVGFAVVVARIAEYQ